MLEALEDAAQRGVRLQLIINGAFLDEDIQSAVDLFNEQWNYTQGYDTSAVVMSADEEVIKLSQQRRHRRRRARFWCPPSTGVTRRWCATARWAS